jgi:hypothetical protein
LEECRRNELIRGFTTLNEIMSKSLDHGWTSYVKAINPTFPITHKMLGTAIIKKHTKTLFALVNNPYCQYNIKSDELYDSILGNRLYSLVEVFMDIIPMDYKKHKDILCTAVQHGSLSLIEKIIHDPKRQREDPNGHPLDDDIYYGDEGNMHVSGVDDNAVIFAMENNRLDILELLLTGKYVYTSMINIKKAIETNNWKLIELGLRFVLDPHDAFNLTPEEFLAVWKNVDIYSDIVVTSICSDLYVKYLLRDKVISDSEDINKLITKAFCHKNVTVLDECFKVYPELKSDNFKIMYKQIVDDIKDLMDQQRLLEEANGIYDDFTDYNDFSDYDW